MKDKRKNISFKIEEELLRKFHYVCDYEGRPINRQLLYYIRNLIVSFEKEHGEIELNSEEQK